MFTLYDLMSGQHGQTLDDLAARFGVGRAQIEAATAALAPAFAEGLKRSFADPQAMTARMQAWQRNALGGLAGGATAGPDAGGLEALAAMFGSEAVRAAVVEQAAQASGVSGDLMRKMLPPLTANLLGGMAQAFARGLQPQTAASNPAAAWANSFADFMKNMGQAPGKEADSSAQAGSASAAAPAAPDMLALGRELSEQNTRAMSSIFEAFLGPRKAGG